MTSRIRYGQFLIQTAPLIDPFPIFRPDLDLPRIWVTNTRLSPPSAPMPLALKHHPDRTENPVHISLTPVSLRCAPISFRHMLLESPRAEIRQRPRHRCPGAPHRRVWIPSGLEMHNTCASSNDHPQVPDQRSGSGRWPLAVGSRSCRA